MTDPLFYTVAEVAALLRVSPMSVYRLTEKDELAVVKVGRSFRIHHAEVAAYIQRNTTGAADERVTA